jgi:transcriptional regulator with XRE-family HTH domain
MTIQTANRLIALRKKQGMSQEQLAEALNLSRQAVSKWERGESSPDTDNLIALAEIYDISLDELVGLDNGSARKRQNGETESAGEPAQLDRIDELTLEKEDPGEKPESKTVSSVESTVAGHSRDITRLNFKTDINWKTFPYPVLVALVYALMGALANMWHPGWILFLTVPIYYTALRKNEFNINRIEFPLLVTPIYLMLGFIWDLWHPGWVLFLMVPLYYSMRKYFRIADIDIPVAAGLIVMLALMWRLFGMDRIVWLALLIMGAALLVIFVLPDRKKE